MKPYANSASASRTTKVVALCQFCGKRSKPCWPDKDGEPEMWDIGNGWSESPYPHDFVHADGSVGSLFTCPPCNKRLRAGEVLTTRDGRAAREIA